MEYQVPQFIEVEDKIVGPLTLRQFIYLAGAGGLTIASIFYLPTLLAILIVIPIAGLGVALAFYKVNGKPFIEILEAGFNYYVGKKFFLWKQKDAEAQAASAATAAAEAAQAAVVAPHEPKLTRGKLSELAWSLDVTTPGQGSGSHNP